MPVKLVIPYQLLNLKWERMLTTVGESLQAITESIEIDGYYEMIMNYLSAENVKFVAEHNFVAIANGNELIISRKNS
ncbi:MAG: hypothetical protein ACI4HQ_13240 [Acetatifactor sp.]